MSITIIRPGMASTFQDLGRHGHQHLGVPVSGAMDPRAHQLANLIAGNECDTATLEVTLVGPELRFNTSCCIALAGADLDARVNGSTVPMYRPLIMRAGDVLSFGERRSGTRCYIAWHGGLDLPRVMGSQSTWVRGSLGGFQGRALQRGDTIGLNARLRAPACPELQVHLAKMAIYLPGPLTAGPRACLRVLKGPHTELFTPQARQALFNHDYRIASDSDRMGYRLQGPLLPLLAGRQLPSEGASFGSIQVTSAGLPIVLMADRQSVGGYPKIGHIATVDLPQLAQCMPGEHLRFEEVDLAQAQQLDLRREQAFNGLRNSLAALRARIRDCIQA